MFSPVLCILGLWLGLMQFIKMETADYGFDAGKNAAAIPCVIVCYCCINQTLGSLLLLQYIPGPNIHGL